MTNNARRNRLGAALAPASSLHHHQTPQREFPEHCHHPAMQHGCTASIVGRGRGRGQGWGRDTGTEGAAQQPVPSSEAADTPGTPSLKGNSAPRSLRNRQGSIQAGGSTGCPGTQGLKGRKLQFKLGVTGRLSHWKYGVRQTLLVLGLHAGAE